jgi:hypothetical protein
MSFHEKPGSPQDLVHFGVKGMKWREKKEPQLKPSEDSRLIPYDQYVKEFYSRPHLPIIINHIKTQANVKISQVKQQGKKAQALGQSFMKQFHDTPVYRNGKQVGVDKGLFTNNAKGLRNVISSYVRPEKR